MVTDTVLATLSRIERQYGISVAANDEERILTTIAYLESGVTGDNDREVKHWRVTAEQVLSDAGLLTEAPTESVTPDRFRQLLQPQFATHQGTSNLLKSAGSDLSRLFEALNVGDYQPLLQIDQAIAQINFLKASQRKDESTSCLFELFNELGVNSDAEAIDQINLLKAWKAFGLQVCNLFNLYYSDDEVPSVDAIEAQPQLRDAIARWAGDCGQHWDSVRLSIAESLVEELLAKIVENPEATDNEVNILITSEDLLKDAIDLWTHRTFNESWNIEFLGIATKLVTELLNAVRDRDDLTEASVLIPLITPIREVDAEIRHNPPSLRDAIAHSGIYCAIRSEINSEINIAIEEVCSLRVWNQFTLAIADIEKQHSIQVPRNATPIDRALANFLVLRSRYKKQLEEFQSFQSDVICYLRALALTVESTANGGTHAEKDARFRGVIALLETSIDRVRKSHSDFVSSHYWNQPDLFRSDYPVRPLLDKLRQQEAEIKALKGESPKVESISDDLIF